MRNMNKQPGYKGQKLDGRTVALGVLGSVALAVVCFFVGLLFLGPMIKSHFNPPQEVRHPSVHIPSAGPQEPSPVEEDLEEPPALDVEITERGVDDVASSDDQAAESSEGTGVRQDRDELVLTLDPERDENRASDVSTEPKEPQKSTERPRAATQPKPQGLGRDIFRVQAGTFADKTNADNLVARLNSKGFKARVTQVRTQDRTLYKVTLAEYKTREDAQELANDLTAEGFSPVVVIEKKE